MTAAGARGRALVHLAVIPDGNRRWAAARGEDAAFGHRAGARRVLDLLGWCEEVEGLTTVTQWGLSTENLARAGGELGGLLDIIVGTVREIARAGRWRVRLIGDFARLPSVYRAHLREAEEASAAVLGRTVNIAVAYGGRDELVRAARRFAADTAQGGAGPFADYLDTAGQPDPDLIIRTGGEQRLSGFLPWQGAYAELYTSPLPWPAFDRAAFDAAVSSYGTRSRTVGL